MGHLHHVAQADDRRLNDVERLRAKDNAIVFEHLGLLSKHKACGSP